MGFAGDWRAAQGAERTTRRDNAGDLHGQFSEALSRHLAAKTWRISFTLDIMRDEQAELAVGVEAEAKLTNFEFDGRRIEQGTNWLGRRRNNIETLGTARSDLGQ